MDWQAVSQRVVELIRLPSSPVAVRLLHKGEPVPPDVQRPAGMTVCQLVTLARIHGQAVLGDAESIVCGVARAMLGLAAFQKDQAGRFAGLRVRDEEAYWNILRDMPKVPAGSREAVVVAPLEGTPVEPESILIFADGARMLRLLHAVTWKTGERVAVRTAAEAGTCGEAIAAVTVTGKPAVGFPCYGSRTFGLVADDEIIFALPAGMVGDFMEGLEATHARISPYPIRKWVSPPPSPRVYFIKPDLSPQEQEELARMRAEKLSAEIPRHC